MAGQGRRWRGQGGVWEPDRGVAGGGAGFSRFTKALGAQDCDGAPTSSNTKEVALRTGNSSIQSQAQAQAQARRQSATCEAR